MPLLLVKRGHAASRQILRIIISDDILLAFATTVRGYNDGENLCRRAHDAFDFRVVHFSPPTLLTLGALPHDHQMPPSSTTQRVIMLPDFRFLESLAAPASQNIRRRFSKEATVARLALLHLFPLFPLASLSDCRKIPPFMPLTGLR